jgi:hypothetical protein
MINCERYIDDILKTKNCDFGFNKRDRKIIECDARFCDECLFNPKNNGYEPSCNVARLKWLILENKEPIKLNRLEYEILKFIEFGYIARDEDGNLFSFWYKPKKVKDIWDCDVPKNQNYSRDLTLFNELFAFIKWEDAEPTLIQNVLNNCEVIENA